MQQTKPPIQEELEHIFNLSKNLHEAIKEYNKGSEYKTDIINF